MAPLRTLIVDDEPAARQGIRVLLAGDPEIEIIGECADGLTAAQAIRDDPPDLLFLDVQMPEMNGFEVLDAVGPDAVRSLVFVTAYDQYALKAFDARALDYLLKPFTAARFGETVERARRALAGEAALDMQQRIGSVLEEVLPPLRDRRIAARVEEAFDAAMERHVPSGSRRGDDGATRRYLAAKLFAQRVEHRRDLQEALSVEVFFRTEDSGLGGATQERLTKLAALVEQG